MKTHTESNCYQTPAEILIPKLEKVRKRGSGSWMACCPAHEDKRPSLSVRSFQDGSISVKCFAGCSTADVLAAVGLNPSDLFPRQHNDYAPGYSQRPGPPWKDLITYLREDLQVVQIGAARLAAGDELTKSDLDRLGIVALHVYETLQAAS